MLVQKKIDNKKLAIYVAIIVAMIGGTIFFIQKNSALTKRKPVPVVMLAMGDMEEDIVDIVNVNINSDNEINSKEDEEKKTELSENDKLKLLNSTKVMDLDILFDQKFKNLKESVVKPVEFIVGNKDLFKSTN